MRHDHLVKWEMVTWPKANGGLGIPNVKPKNQALLVKLGWCLIQANDMLRAKTLIAEYLHDPRSPYRLRNIFSIRSSVRKINPILE